MFHPRHAPDIAILKFLAGLVAVALLACLWAAASMGAGRLLHSPLLALAVLLVLGALAAGLRRLMLEIAERREAQDLGASELTTLTFPPEPRVQRPRPAQTR